MALVTGASRGLGRAMALALAGCGAHVVVNGRNEEGIAATHGAILAAGGAAMAFDTTDTGAADAAVDRIEAEVGRLDILVNNAGYGNGRSGSETSNGEWDEIINVDLNACFRLARRASVGAAVGCAMALPVASRTSVAVTVTTTSPDGPGPCADRRARSEKPPITQEVYGAGA